MDVKKKSEAGVSDKYDDAYTVTKKSVCKKSSLERVSAQDAGQLFAGDVKEGLERIAIEAVVDLGIAGSLAFDIVPEGYAANGELLRDIANVVGYCAVAALSTAVILSARALYCKARDYARDPHACMK